ncbi:MAG: Sapep family Mn(2+)-dependent dipeptidase [Armatimonadetes bacterium]|nr:Sapep family Mn(2+)-dependent dipeptidase [Armatimonadota bacterium]
MPVKTKPQAVERAQAWLEEHQDELLADLRAMLRIPSVQGEAEPNAPFGSENRRALDLALRLGEKWGMRTRDVEGYAGHAEFGDGEPLVMALGHLDVVPAGDGWKHEPFGAEIDGGYVYARGAQDDKGPTMAIFYAARALKETGADLPARLRVVFGCNEESGFKCVKRYFEVEEAPTLGVAPDAAWPLIHAEKGIANLTIRVPLPKGAITLTVLQGGSRPNVVPDKARAVLVIAESEMAAVREKCDDYWDRNVSFTIQDRSVEIDAIGSAAHGSTPFEGDNAIVRALRAAAALAPAEQQEQFSKLLAIGHTSGAGLGIHGRDDVSEDLTTNLAIAEVAGGAAVLTINVRYPVEWKGADVRERCSEFLKEEFEGAEVEDFSDSPPLYFPLDREPVKTILEAYREEIEEDKEPGVMGGGTYARAVPNTVSIGTGWEGDGPAHQHDERLKVEHLHKMARIYANILYRLTHAAAR